MKSKYAIKKPECEWDGLTLDEIRYARAITETRIMISREIISSRTQGVLSGEAINPNAQSMMGRMFGALSWLDYGVMAIRVVSKLRSMFGRKKKK